MSDISLQLMTGADILMPDIGLFIHQPTIKEISLMGENAFLICLNLLLLDKESVFAQSTELLDQSLPNLISQENLKDITNLDIFLFVLNNKEVLNAKLQRDLYLFLKLLFVDFDSIDINASIHFHQLRFLMKKKDREYYLDINHFSFNFLQNALHQMFCTKELSLLSLFNSSAEQDFNPANKKAQEIAAKLAQGRKKIALQQAQDNNQAGSSGSVFAQYISILTVGLQSMSISDCTNCTIYQIWNLYTRYSLFMAWDLDLRERLAWANPETHPDNWMKTI